MEKGPISAILFGSVTCLVGVVWAILLLATQDVDLSTLRKSSSQTEVGRSWQEDYNQFVGLKSYTISLSERDINGWLSWKFKLPPEIKTAAGDARARFMQPTFTISDNLVNFILPIKFEAGKKSKKIVYWIEQGNFVKTSDGHKWHPTKIAIGRARLPFSSLWGTRSLESFARAFKLSREADDFIRSWSRVTDSRIVDNQLILVNQ